MLRDDQKIDEGTLVTRAALSKENFSDTGEVIACI